MRDCLSPYRLHSKKSRTTEKDVKKPYHLKSKKSRIKEEQIKCFYVIRPWKGRRFIENIMIISLFDPVGVVGWDGNFSFSINLSPLRGNWLLEIILFDINLFSLCGIAYRLTACVAINPTESLLRGGNFFFLLLDFLFLKLDFLFMVKKSDFLGWKIGFIGSKNRIFWGEKSDFLGKKIGFFGWNIFF